MTPFGSLPEHIIIYDTSFPIDSWKTAASIENKPNCGPTLMNQAFGVDNHNRSINRPLLFFILFVAFFSLIFINITVVIVMQKLKKYHNSGSASSYADMMSIDYETPTRDIGIKIRVTFTIPIKISSILRDSISTMSKHSFYRMHWRDMEWYDNIFDVMDDNEDMLECTPVELNRYYMLGQLPANAEEQYEIEASGIKPDIETILSTTYTDDNQTKMTTDAEKKTENKTTDKNNDGDNGDDDDDDDDDDDEEEEEEEEEEEVLSQQLSQLSTEGSLEEETIKSNRKRTRSTTRSLDVAPKKMKPTRNDTAKEQNTSESIEQDKSNDIPRYLSLTNPEFLRVIENIQKTTNSIGLSDIQMLALLMHRITILRIQKHINIVYLQSGTGQLNDSSSDLIEVDRRVWHKDIKSILSMKRAQTSASVTVEEITSNDEQANYENLINSRLQETNEKIEQYTQQLTDKKSNLTEFTTASEEIIVQYVQHYGIIPLQMKRDFKIAVLKHDYNGIILQRKYEQENPNEYQVEIAERLCTAKYESEKSKRELIELKQRVFYYKFDTFVKDVELSSLLSSASAVTFNDKHQRLAQRKKLDLFASHISRAELKYYQTETKFKSEYKKMLDNHRNLVRDKGMTTSLRNLLEQRLTNITDRLRTIHYHRINYFLRSSYGDWESKSQDTQTIHTREFLSNVMIDTMHELSPRQMQLLSRGPTYVPPCQSRLSSFSKSAPTSTSDIVKKQYAPLKHQIASLLSKHRLSIASSWDIRSNICYKFTNLFAISIPYNMQKRAIDEIKLVQSIRSSLKTNNLILRRTADNQNTFYIGNREEFELKGNKFLSGLEDVYECVGIIGKDNSDHKENQIEDPLYLLSGRIEAINFALETLQKRKALEKDTISKLIIDSKNVKLPYLYFLPDMLKEDEMSLVPIIVAHQSITSNIATYVNQLIGPFANEKMKQWTFCNEADFMTKLITYACDQHRLKPTTLFCTIQITNFYSLDVHSEMIATVIAFLRDKSAYNKVNKVSISIIENLLQLFLYQNLFSYQNKIYIIKKGSPRTMSLSETLANIYLYDWQKSILNQFEYKQELFGRHKDRIFFTWNKSSNILQAHLESLQKQHPSVKFRLSIGPNVHYWNTYIENRRGELYTRVYHDPMALRYTMPYVVGHSKVQHSEWLRSALLRAVCYCSSVEDFHRERIYLELTYLANGYSFYFVESHVQNFFNYFEDDLMRYSSDQTSYDTFRRRWFDLFELQSQRMEKLQQLDANKKVARFSYYYDYGPRCEFNQYFRELWSKQFASHSTLSNEKFKIFLTTKHIYSLNTLLSSF
ncbi:unnamed protein product [Adineta ricciae]|uniref:Helix-turn-helix domain-containing protein n=1 Tax=Adineta ricciae TaxID=249248 RepID=A0A815TXR3_ADIRI|nr:unnamed protein product [Adineta ricciae]